MARRSLRGAGRRGQGTLWVDWLIDCLFALCYWTADRDIRVRFPGLSLAMRFPAGGWASFFIGQCRCAGGSGWPRRMVEGGGDLAGLRRRSTVRVRALARSDLALP